MNWQERAEAVFAQGCNTYSKRAGGQYPKGPVIPTHVVDGYGPYLFDANGKRYVDFVGGLGSNLISANNNFSLPHVREIELAERIKSLFPCIDKLRILKTGSDACSAAVRIARAHKSLTADEVIGSGYHGWGNTFIAAETPGAGCLSEKYIKVPSIDDVVRCMDALHRPNRVAAVIIEPVQLDMSVKPKLELIRRMCTEKDITLIFDEVITGFRVPEYSFANYWGIQPDLICLGKGLGNGYPISILGGRAEIMDAADWFVSGTFFGELAGIDAAMRTLDYITPGKLRDLWETGEKFQENFNRLDARIQLIGYPTRAELQGDENIRTLFMQEMAKRGYFFGKAWFLTFSHTQEILGATLQAASAVIESIRADRVALECEPAKPIFKRN